MKIVIQPRGAKPMVLPLKFQARVPQVQILETVFNFGSLTTHGIAGVLPLTLVNSSSVPATLIMDLRKTDASPGLECLSIALVENKAAKFTLKHRKVFYNVLEQIEDDSVPAKKVEQNNNIDSVSEKSDVEDKELHNDDEVQTRYYRINLSPNT